MLGIAQRIYIAYPVSRCAGNSFKSAILSDYVLSVRYSACYTLSGVGFSDHVSIKNAKKIFAKNLLLFDDKVLIIIT